MVYFLVGIAGMAGALTRYYISSWTNGWNITAWPLATFLINLTGTFFLSWLMSRFQTKNNTSLWVTVFGTGFIGAYTTFSTFSVETVHLIQSGSWFLAFCYAGSSFGGGLILAWLGYSLGKKELFKKSSVKNDG